ncbi:DUF397 domain-containing protein [Streptomyces gelaticus]|uniref:DUF397 domain-containing protein n=1 Tax=Streptomyces gelaticus TaxID=285446 RepID=UPI001E4A6C7F|nr:DUF397 domain-containing protein [Streptomyces gelaticus]
MLRRWHVLALGRRRNTPRTVAVRDSKRSDGPVVVLGPAAWKPSMPGWSGRRADRPGPGASAVTPRPCPVPAMGWVRAPALW